MNNYRVPCRYVAGLPQSGQIKKPILCSQRLKVNNYKTFSNLLIRGELVLKMVKLSLTKPDLLRQRKVETLSPAAALLLAGVERRETESEKEQEVRDFCFAWRNILNRAITPVSLQSLSDL